VSRWTLALFVLAGCEAFGNKGATGGAGDVAESGTRQGSAGGFSATMSSELAKAGIGGPVSAAPPSPGPSVLPIEPADSAGSATGATSAETTVAGSADQASATGADATAVTGQPGDAVRASDAIADSKAADTQAASDAKATDARATDAKAAADSKPGPAGDGKLVAGAQAVGAVRAPATRSYVKPPAEIAAIKFDLEPNWERDMGEAATISLVVKVPSSNDARMFSVRYGYEDQAAPVDCDQYRKHLENTGAMKVTMNRQRGAACYIEGTDRGGVMAYRYLLTYGGKRLMCHGSLYKDPASAALGDLRDKVLQQAKKICETLAL
jgi:hypothetical protein